jgi:hypothetical protein
MSTYQQRLAAAAAKRLSLILHDAADLNFQLSELNRLRDRVRLAEVSAGNRIVQAKERPGTIVEPKPPLLTT